MSRRVIPGLEAPDEVLEAEIRTRLDQVENALEKSVQVESSGLLSETSSYLIAAGGKRFRAMLVLLAGYFGDPADPRLIPGSVSIELVHLATLYHDDVIDEADARRGAPSANVALGQHGRDPHRRLPVRAGLGDLHRPRRRGLPAARPHDRGAVRRSDPRGRQLGQVEQPDDNYLEIIRRKTASLIAHLLPPGRHALGRRARAHGHPRGSSATRSAWPTSSPTTSWTSRRRRWSSARNPAWT